MVTIYDIAKLAGVSPPSVSKAINGSHEISEATRARIQAIAKELGYTPNAHAKALTRRRSYLVGVLYTEMHTMLGLEHPLFSGIINAFKERMEASGYELVFITRNLGGASMSFTEHCRYRSVDAVYIANALTGDPDLADLLKAGFQCVSGNNIFPGVPAVVSDNEASVKEATLYLAALGHRRIAHITGTIDPMAPAAIERHRGYLAGLEEAGIAYDPGLYVDCVEWNFEEGVKGMRTILERGRKPTAVITGCDIMAFGAMRTLREAGLSIPKDVSVIGFDDYDISAYYQPSLTTIRQDRAALGYKAAELLLGLMGGSKPGCLITKIPTRFMERQSTGPAPA
jgi:DNA-binding LacI/PurR family transcriptional regulator